MSLQDNTEGREVNKQCLAVREQRLAVTQHKIKYIEDRNVQVEQEYARSLRDLSRAREEAENDLCDREDELQKRYPHLRFPDRKHGARINSSPATSK